MNGSNNKVALFAGLSSFLAVFENFIPMPIPFLRIGISNIPVSIGFVLFKFKDLLFIVLFKTIFSHLFRGTLFSYVFIIALSGNLLFIFISFPFYQIFKTRISFISLGLIGALSHNLGQIFASFIFLPAKSALLIGYFIISIGLISGFANGYICNIVYRKFFTRALYGKVV